MATYSLTTEAPEEALLSWVVTQHNKEHDLNQTNSEYMYTRFYELLAPFQTAYKEALGAVVLQKFAAPPEVQGQILTLLQAAP